MAASNETPSNGEQHEQTAERPVTDAMDVDQDKSVEVQEINEDLEQLHELHIKLRHLRSLLPRLLEPISRAESKSPKELFDLISKSRNDAQTELNEFQQMWQNEASTRALERAKESRRQNPMGIKPWKATDHPDWYTSKR